jgi:SAM-dependent methyltransferase
MATHALRGSIVLAPRIIPEGYRRWNRQHGAPFGHPPPPRTLTKALPSKLLTRFRGPFSIQRNNTIRKFEYPWAYEVAEIKPGQNVLEVGGGLSGLQFVFEKAGAHVVNVDPGMAAEGIGWHCDAASMARLNRIFGTKVDLRNGEIGDAALAPSSFDVAVSISVLEHLTDRDLRDVMTGVFNALRPGGLFVITLDLFLEVEPFTHRKDCAFGRNVNVQNLIGVAPFVLEYGNREELHGFEQFVPENVIANLSRYLIGEYPALAQCLTLRKPS